MAKGNSNTAAAGFSLIEMMVAMAFTLVLMAGMATVYKGSLTQFYTAGEGLSSARRNRMSMDLLGDDLNTAGMYMQDLANAPLVDPKVPPFFIIPNTDITDASTDGPKSTDELYFYLDQPLPFEGTLTGAATQKTASEAVVDGKVPTEADRTFKIECNNASYAKLLKKGQAFIFKDSFEVSYINADPSVTGTVATVVAGPDPQAGMTGSGSTGQPLKNKHLSTDGTVKGTGIVALLHGQMVRYRIEMLKLDPLKSAGSPCLVRDQGAYSASGFTADQTQQVIAENVSGFKVFLSANGGSNWAGEAVTAKDFDKGWDTGIRAALDTQLGTSGRPNFKTTRGSEHWFRSIPTLVRVDISTRTANARTEYSKDPKKLAYREQTQSLVFVPRHFGLPMN